MSKLIRLLTTDNFFFVTIVTFERQPILCESAVMLRTAIESAMSKLRADELAWVILPDHYHAIIRANSISISTIVQCFKMSFASQYRLATGIKSGRIWQSRFWDHVIRNEHDLKTHLDYIHYNPIKHGCASDPAEYRLSSYRTYLQAGNYPRDWGRVGPRTAVGNFGE